MAIFYLILWVCILGISDKKIKKKKFIRRYYEAEKDHSFVFIEKVIRFAYFTVVWACTLQFTWFMNEPQPFHIWNSILLIVLFILAVIYPFIAFIYLHRRFDSISRKTFIPLYFGLRIEGGKKFLYFIFKYYKLLIIALLIGLLYNANPLAVLIPLLSLNLADGIILIIAKPFYLEYPEEKLIVSWFQRNYLKMYWISHIIQNFLFVVLEILMIAAFARRILDSREVYLGLGYACSVFAVIILFVGVFRLFINIIQIFEDCYDDVKAEAMKVESV